MKVLLVNTHEKKGGAGVACHRLYTALKLKMGSVRLLVQYKKSEDTNTVSISGNPFSALCTFIRFVIERFYFILLERTPDVRFGFSPANTGYDISKLPEVKNADIIHLHWVNQGFLSLRSLKKLKKSKIPVVWTLHDMWAFTGGCHYSGACIRYEHECGNCPFLKHPHRNDLSYKVWKQKQKVMENFSNLTIVTCSNWLQDLANKSSLLKNKNILSIPNCIDTSIFFPKDKAPIRKKLGLPSGKKLILFGAMNTSDKRKGFQFLVEALLLMKEKYPAVIQEIELIVFGKSTPEVLSQLCFKFHDLQVISSEEKMVDTYCSADIFVIPSLEDNLPNTIMESLACGIPVVAFETGGIPEMVSHKENGYLSKYRSSEDLADGLYWTLFDSDLLALSKHSREKVISSYGMDIIAGKYQQLYQELISTNYKKL